MTSGNNRLKEAVIITLILLKCLPRYFKYVLRHKWFVFVECCKLGIPWRGIMHDMSKFYPSEFIPYALTYSSGKWKYDERPQWLVDMYNRAWLSHQHKNPHHPQYWILRLYDDVPKEVLAMPYKHIKEMLADWKGAGKALGFPDTLQWYMDKGHKHVLHHVTRRWIEDMLSCPERYCRCEQCKRPPVDYSVILVGYDHGDYSRLSKLTEEQKHMRDLTRPKPDYPPIVPFAKYCPICEGPCAYFARGIMEPDND